MKIVFFGLSITSAWGNGHATLLRGLFRALHCRGHEVHFFERDVDYYSNHRDALSFPFVQVHLYADWLQTLPLIKAELAGAECGVVTSYCPDGSAASEMILQSAVPRKIFYDMDTPVTLQRVQAGETLNYLPKDRLSGFDLVLSYTGGESLRQLREILSAQRVAALYGWVDPATHFRASPCTKFRADLSYLGTYSPDRQAGVEALLIEPARRMRDANFMIGGAMYPSAEIWPPNIRRYEHVVPAEHSAFYSSSRLTLSVTRGCFAATGYCPSGRFFEAAACGTAVLSDWWHGLDTFFEPGAEILIATSTADTLRALSLDTEEIHRIGSQARDRALSCHTANIRAQRFLDLIEDPQDESAASTPAICVAEGIS